MKQAVDALAGISPMSGAYRKAGDTDTTATFIHYSGASVNLSFEFFFFKIWM